MDEPKVDNTLPFKDGQAIAQGHGIETVAGEVNVPHEGNICWTIQGQWYDRDTGVEMVRINEEMMTVKEFYCRRVDGRL